MKTFAPLALAASALIAAPLAAQEAPPPAHTDTTPEATQGIGPGARPVGAQWSRSPVVAPQAMAATKQLFHEVADLALAPALERGRAMNARMRGFVRPQH